MQRAERPTDMKHLADDITTSVEWAQEQTDRLLGFEVLRNALAANYQPIDPADLGDRVAIDKGVSHRIIKNLQAKLNAEV